MAIAGLANLGLAIGIATGTFGAHVVRLAGFTVADFPGNWRFLFIGALLGVSVVAAIASWRLMKGWRSGRWLASGLLALALVNILVDFMESGNRTSAIALPIFMVFAVFLWMPATGRYLIRPEPFQGGQ